MCDLYVKLWISWYLKIVCFIKYYMKTKEISIYLNVFQ